MERRYECHPLFAMSVVSSVHKRHYRPESVFHNYSQHQPEIPLCQFNPDINNSTSIAAQHALHQISQRTPVILPAVKLVLVDKQDIMFEACVEMRLEAQMHDYRVVMAVNMGVYSV
jgi:hypothetical protein